jgi:hypothetical protein
MKFTIFWDIAPRSPVQSCQARDSSEPMGSGQHHFLLPSGPYIIAIPTDCPFCLATCSCWFLAQLIFDPENGGDTFLWNVGSYLDYTALYPRRRHISSNIMFRKYSWAPGYPVSKHPKFSLNHRKFQRKFAIFIKSCRNKFAVHACSHAMQMFSQPQLAALPTVLHADALQ